MIMKSVSVIMPTYNSMRVFKMCIDSILQQDYPHNLIEILFIDGGSKDGTLDAIYEYQKNSDIRIVILPNPLRTAEAGKAIGVKEAQNEIIALIDSDNILPESDWLAKLMKPFQESNIVASEPIEFTYRKSDGVFNRYFALIGMGDPLCMFTGNYDRMNLITNKWTDVEREEIDKGDYLSIKFKENMIPTIGANGFLIRKIELLENFDGDYLFDIDVLWELFKKDSSLRVAKVKTGTVHLFAPDIKTFYRKQNRRIKDFLYFNKTNDRKYPWNKVGKAKLILFCLCCVTIIPLLIQAVIGYSRKHDLAAWAFHLPACWITLWVYGAGTIGGIFKKEMISREGWKQ